MKYLIFFFGVLFTTIGCDNTSNPTTNFKEGLFFSVEKNQYSVNELIQSTITNNNNSSAYFYHCSYEIIPEIERKENGRWNSYYASACLAIYPAGIMRLNNGDRNINNLVVSEAGIYRLKYSYSFTDSIYLDKQIYSVEITVE